MIETQKSNGTLEVMIPGSFNLVIRNLIESRLTDEITSLIIDLSNCKLIDSEGIIFMYRWQQSGKKLELKNPPDILFEMLDILELSDHWDPQQNNN